MNRLRELRKEKNKTQQQIADILGLTQQAYATYENETRTPPTDMVVKLADYFNVSTDYLLERDKATNEPPPEQRLEGMYFHLAKEAQEMGLQQEDIDFMLDFYKRHKQRNEEYLKNNKEK